jgi:peptidyl-tRNA hydrolase
VSDLVQAIAVHKDPEATHEDVVMACALAATKALLGFRDDPIWDEWLAGRFTKTVRRGTKAQLVAVIPESAGVAVCNGVQAFAFYPMTYEDFPKPLAKMQVQGLDQPRAGVWTVKATLRHDDPMVVINPAVEMTTGKMAAQVAHGLMAAVLRRDDRTLGEWLRRGMPWGCFTADPGVPGQEFNGAPASEWLTYVDRCPIHIEDAGFTEVEPGTLTVVAK